MTKKDIYVVVDTPKKAKMLKKVLELFAEKIYSETDRRLSNGLVSIFFPYVEFFSLAWRGAEYTHKTKVSVKQLRNILAKEHLKVGDYVVLKNGLIGKIIKLLENSEILVLDGENDKITCSIKDFKRYATPEEIALLEPKKVDKFAELKEAHKNGAVIQLKHHTGGWVDLKDPQFDTTFSLYRIKPEEIKDSDISTIEALHDVLLYNHKYDFNSKLLTNARELCKKLQNIIGGN